MTVRVLVTESAQADMLELKAYLLDRFGLKIWRNCLNELRTGFDRIARYPELGRIPDELASLQMLQFLQVIVGKNRIVYELRDGVVYVHLVCDTRRDLAGVLMRRIVRS